MYPKIIFKFPRVMLIVAGGFLTLIGFMSILTAILISYTPSPNPQAENTYIFMPILVLIGIAYMALGIFMKRINNKLLVHIVISILLLILTIFWTIFSLKTASLNNKPDPFIGQLGDKIMKVITVVMTFAVIIFAQVFIGIKLRKLERNINAS